MSEIPEKFLTLLKAQREVLERRLATWKSKEMPAYGRTIEQKVQLDSEIERLSRLLRGDDAANAGAPSPRVPASRTLVVHGKTGDPEVAKRTALVRSNPGTPAVDMCTIFDREKVPLTRSLQEADFSTWSRAYKSLKYRARIDTLISKDRHRN